MRSITPDLLKEDQKIYERMRELQGQILSVTDEKLRLVYQKDIDKLHRMYYIDNDDIRIYWKTY